MLVSDEYKTLQVGKGRCVRWGVVNHVQMAPAEKAALLAEFNQALEDAPATAS